MRKTLGLTIFTLGIGAFLLNLVLESKFYLVMPRVPEATSNRTHEFRVMRTQIYVTALERRQGELAGQLAIWGTIGALAAALALKLPKR